MRLRKELEKIAKRENLSVDKVIAIAINVNKILADEMYARSDNF